MGELLQVSQCLRESCRSNSSQVMTAMFKLVSANLGTSLLSVGDILMTDKPELLFLQEVTCPTNELLTRVTSLGYSAECNVDSLHPTRPGTAIVWKKSLKINEVNSIIERRAQFDEILGGPVRFLPDRSARLTDRSQIIEGSGTGPFF